MKKEFAEVRQFDFPPKKTLNKKVSYANVITSNGCVCLRYQFCYRLSTAQVIYR